MRLLTVLALTGAFLPSGSPDPRLGTWTLVSAQSRIDPANQLIVTPVAGGVHLVMSGETHLDFTATSNGHGNAVAGNPAFNQIELHRISRHESSVKELKDGALVATVRETLSKDGKELTITTAQANKPNLTTIWDRSGGALVDKDPFAGEWTEDLGKTRMHQGLPLKIESDGTGGTRFTWDYSYTGRFDGKPYDVKDSRNDTVQLREVDPHTVESVFQRDNQKTQDDRWVVAADGHTMTLTCRGTLETGQHISETLTFKKQ